MKRCSQPLWRFISMAKAGWSPAPAFSARAASDGSPGGRRRDRTSRASPVRCSKPIGGERRDDLLVVGHLLFGRQDVPHLQHIEHRLALQVADRGLQVVRWRSGPAGRRSFLPDAKPASSILAWPILTRSVLRLVVVALLDRIDRLGAGPGSASARAPCRAPTGAGTAACWSCAPDAAVVGADEPGPSCDDDGDEEIEPDRLRPPRASPKA